VAGIDETRCGALKKASKYSGGMKNSHLTSEKPEPDRTDPNRLESGLKP